MKLNLVTAIPVVWNFLLQLLDCFYTNSYKTLNYFIAAFYLAISKGRPSPYRGFGAAPGAS
ncbi:hypothetical protein ACS8E9_18495 [Pseudomonas neustonica]|jgi:hypothetical protein|uniref:Uncharacterized protein n=1 Tax=marine sediment metagenome TaxID=412755 RepID=A0A0F9RSC5_9ZZZZ|nr:MULTISPECIES: hypothetical protein [Pseudomonas]HEC53574.1 hypothetical protein [Halopseudomonas sabulinigri]